jgi:hypothetical protein
VVRWFREERKIGGRRLVQCGTLGSRTPVEQTISVSDLPVPNGEILQEE